MYLVDTSIWIDLFGTRPKLKVPTKYLPHLGTCPPVIQEVLQGISNQAALNKVQTGFMAMTCYSQSVDLDLYIAAADLFRSGRARGLTIRSSIDCLIATIALKHNLTVWHLDRDYEQIAKFTKLATCRALA